MKDYIVRATAGNAQIRAFAAMKSLIMQTKNVSDLLDIRTIEKIK